MSSDDRPDDRRGRRRWDDDGDYDDYDRPRRRREPAPGMDATDFLIPTGVSGWSIAACYFGLVSCFLPFVGFLIAVVALVCGIVALRRRRKSPTYGAVTSDVRSVIGIILSSLTLLVHIGFVTLAIIKGASE